MRSAFARPILLAAACGLVSACASPPPPLPPRRVSFAQPSAAPVQRAPDLATPTAPPIVHHRYAGWTLGVDALSLIPLTYWMGRPGDLHLALPALLLAPLVHVAHGELDSATISLIMRVAMLGGVYLAGRSFETECEDSSELVCIPARSFLLAELAILPVIVIDSLFLARSARTDDSWYRLPVQPSVAVTAEGHPWLSLSGRF